MMCLSNLKIKSSIVRLLILLILFFSLWLNKAFADNCPQYNNSGCTLCLSGNSNNSGTQATLSWSNNNPPPNVDHYEIWRSDRFLTRFLLATTTQVSFTDTTAQVDKAYLYQVRAVDSNGQVLSISNWDLVTTVVMEDDPLTPQVTMIRAVHITDLRRAVNAVRTLTGLLAASWTYDNVINQPVRAVNAEELRLSLAEALAILGLPVPAWTDSTLSGVIVKAAHLQEIFQAVK